MARKTKKQNGFMGGFKIPSAKPKDFDDAFGLDFDFRDKLVSEQRPRKLFEDFGFTEQFMASQEQQAFDEDDPLVPELISRNFDEPDDRAPPLKETLLFEQLPKVRLGTPIPKTDPDLPKSVKLERKFRRVRSEALETGSAPLDPEEEREFGRAKPTGNLGTTGLLPRGIGFGRF